MLRSSLPQAVKASVRLVTDDAAVQCVLMHAPFDEVQAMVQRLAAQHGAIATLTALPPGDAQVPLQRLINERSISTNTAAAGGNASLMML